MDPVNNYSLGSLPVEILCNIFEDLDDKSLGSLARVASLFRDIITNASLQKTIISKKKIAICNKIVSFVKGVNFGAYGKTIMFCEIAKAIFSSNANIAKSILIDYATPAAQRVFDDDMSSNWSSSDSEASEEEKPETTLTVHEATEEEISETSSNDSDRSVTFSEEAKFISRCLCFKVWVKIDPLFAQKLADEETDVDIRDYFFNVLSVKNAEKDPTYAIRTACKIENSELKSNALSLVVKKAPLLDSNLFPMIYEQVKNIHKYEPTNDEIYFYLIDTLCFLVEKMTLSPEVLEKSGLKAINFVFKLSGQKVRYSHFFKVNNILNRKQISTANGMSSGFIQAALEGQISKNDALIIAKNIAKTDLEDARSIFDKCISNLDTDTDDVDIKEFFDAALHIFPKEQIFDIPLFISAVNEDPYVILKSLGKIKDQELFICLLKKLVEYNHALQGLDVNLDDESSLDDGLFQIFRWAHQSQLNLPGHIWKFLGNLVKFFDRPGFHHKVYKYVLNYGAENWDENFYLTFPKILKSSNPHMVLKLIKIAVHIMISKKDDHDNKENIRQVCKILK